MIDKLSEPDNIQINLVSNPGQRTQSGLPVVTGETVLRYNNELVHGGNSFQKYSDELRTENPDLAFRIDTYLAAFEGTHTHEVALRGMHEVYAVLGMQSEAYNSAQPRGGWEQGYGHPVVVPSSLDRQTSLDSDEGTRPWSSVYDGHPHHIETSPSGEDKLVGVIPLK